MSRKRQLPYLNPLISDEFVANGIVLKEEHQDYTSATEAFSQAILLEPQSAVAYWHRGWPYWHQGNRSASKADFLKAIELDPSLEDDVALTPPETVYDRYITRNPNDYRALCFRGVRYYVEEFEEEALEQYNQSIFINNAYPFAFYNRAHWYLSRNNYAQAIKDFSRVVELLPTSIHAHYYRALSHQQMGNNELKRKDLETCLTLTIERSEKKHIQKALKGEVVFAFASTFPDDEQEDEYIDEEDELAEEED
jgi:tetratricopeptide (TPR) repeat protein